MAECKEMSLQFTKNGNMQGNEFMSFVKQGNGLMVPSTCSGNFSNCTKYSTYSYYPVRSGIIVFVEVFCENVGEKSGVRGHLFYSFGMLGMTHSLFGLLLTIPYVSGPIRKGLYTFTYS